MTEEKELPAEESPPQSEGTVQYFVETEVIHIISSTPPALKAQPPDWDVPPQLSPFKRTAWVPVVEEGDGEVADSKFAGTPWLGESEEWPRCTNCGNPIQLFLQLNLAQLPEAVRGEYGTGLLQLFYCTNEEPMCEDDCEAFFPFSKSVVVRLIEPEGEPARPNSIEQEFPPKRIVGWREVEDYPNWQEGKELGVEMDAAEWDAVWNSGSPKLGDKLGGWAYWVQDIEYPDCPTCGQSMQLVFQIDSSDNLPFDFGDVGCSHITQCPTHKDQLAFGWACS